ncbi:hypothetical protein [Nitriliruptor alkaliphilus]|uniref:hypothetical protein n=1 Tax=Nitriliruptor alkaliphilus TaxID=427918 RepID=UPI0006986A59|nr:hypothetical protein [Nitriliruptor alkaliphilus]
MQRYLRSTHSDESGAVAIVAGVSLVAMLLMAAFIVDLGAVRADRTSSQSVGDMAATAAAGAFGESESYQEGCIAGLEYAVSNLRGLTVSASDLATACASFTSPCTDSTAVRTATLTVDPYVITVTNPVPDDNFRMDQQAIDEAIDGTPCDRFAVEVQRSRSFIFGGLAGIFDTTSQRGAIAVTYLVPGPNDYASLIVLQRNGCQTLANTGGGQIRVFDLEGTDPETGDPRTYEGIISVDTLPSGCSGMQKVIDQAGSTGSLTEASGRIFAHALATTDPGNLYTYNPARVPANLRPQPEPGPLITRAPVDHLFNCLATYPAFSATATWSPSRAGQPIDGCEAASATPARPPYIQRLRTALAPIDTATAASDQGHGVFAEDDCNDAEGTYTPADFGGAQILFMDCPISGGDRLRPTAAGLQLDGFSHIIFRDGLVFDNGELRINGPTIVYVPTGGIDASGASMRLRSVFAYVDAPSGTGERFRTSGSSDTLAWMAPLDDTPCETYSTGLPPAGCFVPLALWSNAMDRNELAGNGNGGIIGSFFTPNATFRFRGSSTISTAPCTATPDWNTVNTNTGGVFNLEGAQFFAEIIDTAGNASVRMCPSPTTTIPTMSRAPGLIR